MAHTGIRQSNITKSILRRIYGGDSVGHNKRRRKTEAEALVNDASHIEEEIEPVVSGSLSLQMLVVQSESPVCAWCGSTVVVRLGFATCVICQHPMRSIC